MPQNIRLSYGPYGLQASIGYRSVRSLAAVDGMTASQASGDYHERYDRLKLVGMSREFYRDNPIYRGLIDRAVSYIVGGGFQLSVNTGDKELDSKIEGYWRNFWKKPDVRGIVPGCSYERANCREWFLCGDTLHIKTNLGKLQHIESEQIGDYTDSGIKVNEYGRPIAFTVGQYSRYGQIDEKSKKPISQADALFICDPERPSSLRGVPACQSSFSMLHRINDVCDSEALAFQMLSRLALAVTREGAAEAAFAEASEDVAGAPFTADRITDIGIGTIFHGNPGESISGVDRNIPSPNFAESLRMFLRLMGLPLGLPLEIILLDWTKSNYSQSRAVLEQAYQTFTSKQDHLEDQFYSPCFEWQLNIWKKQGLVPEAAIVSHRWIRPSWPWIDQLKEVQANGAKIDRGLSTHAAVCMSLHQEPEEVIAQLKRETITAIETAKAIEEETGILPPWQMFCGREVVAGAPVSVVDEESLDKSDGEEVDEIDTEDIDENEVEE